jgi:hypothetical protein
MFSVRFRLNLAYRISYYGLYLLIPARKQRKNITNMPPSGTNANKSRGNTQRIASKKPTHVIMYCNSASNENGTLTSTKITAF